MLSLMVSPLAVWDSDSCASIRLAAQVDAHCVPSDPRCCQWVRRSARAKPLPATDWLNMMERGYHVDFEMWLYISVVFFGGATQHENPVQSSFKSQPS
jgi:hypothetical protein